MREELVARLAYGVALRLAQWDAPVSVMELAPPTPRRALPLGVVVTNIIRCYVQFGVMFCMGRWLPNWPKVDRKNSWRLVLSSQGAR